MSIPPLPGVPLGPDTIDQMKRAALATARNLVNQLPEGDHRTNAEIMLLITDISKELDAINYKAMENNGPFFQGQEARDVLDYLKCVHVGLRKFVGDLGLEAEELSDIEKCLAESQEHVDHLLKMLDQECQQRAEDRNYYLTAQRRTLLAAFLGFVLGGIIQILFNF